MRTHIFAACILLYISMGILRSQIHTIDRDLLPDLWIMVVDKSGSMLKSRGFYDINDRNRLWKSIQDDLKQSTLQPDFSKDKFAFLSSGILVAPADSSQNRKKELYRIESLEPFIQSYIHPLDSDSTSIHQFDNRSQFLKQFRRLTFGRDEGYNYQYSFVALIRLYALVRLLEDQPEIFSQVNHIYVWVSSDWQDQNDNWALDYRQLKQEAPSKYKESISAFNRYETNPFNKNSRQLGTFRQVYSTQNNYQSTNRYWHSHIYEYFTLQGMNDTASFAQAMQPWIEINWSDSALLLLPSRLDRGEEIDFIQIDELEVEGKTVAKNEKFSTIHSIPVDPISGLDSLDLQIKGYAQIAYTDTLLGERSYKQYFSDKEIRIDSPWGPIPWSIGHWVLFIAFCLLILCLLYYFFVLNREFLYIRDARGTIYKVRRGIRLPYMLQKMHLAHMSVGETYDHILPLHHFASIEQGEEIGNKDCIYIYSREELSFSTSVEVKHFPQSDSRKELQKDEDYYDTLINNQSLRAYHIYRISLSEETNSKQELSFATRKKRNYEYLLTVERENHHQWIACPISQILSQHTSNLSLDYDLVLIRTNDNEVRWSVILLSYFQDRIDKVFWALDYVQELPQHLGDEEKKELIRHIAYQLPVSLGLKKYCFYHQGNLQLPFPPVFTQYNQQHWDIVKSRYPAHVYLVEDLIFEQTEDYLQASKVVVYRPLEHGLFDERIVKTPQGGRFRLYHSLFPKIEDSLKYIGAIQLLNETILSASAQEDAYFNIHQNPDSSIQVSMLDQENIQTQYK